MYTRKGRGSWLGQSRGEKWRQTGADGNNLPDREYLSQIIKKKIDLEYKTFIELICSVEYKNVWRIQKIGNTFFLFFLFHSELTSQHSFNYYVTHIQTSWMVCLTFVFMMTKHRNVKRCSGNKSLSSSSFSNFFHPVSYSTFMIKIQTLKSSGNFFRWCSISTLPNSIHYSCHYIIRFTELF